MSSRFSLQKPYVVASLPQPIGHAEGQYVVAEVYGGAPGSKKRKRSELAVGIDGEGVNLYDISSSRLITSYALPPQSAFTCPPSSLRIRISKNKVERRTYVSTGGAQPQVILFHDTTEGSAPTSSSTISRNLQSSQHPIVYLGTITAIKSSEFSGFASDLLAVKENGEVQCYDGDSLEEKWTSPATALSRDVVTPVKDQAVEFVQLTNAFSASHGILKNRPDVFALFPQEVEEDGFNPEILVIVAKSASARTRTLHIVNLPRRSYGISKSSKYSVDSLSTADIPSQGDLLASKASFSLQASTGTLQQLVGDVLTTFDLTDSTPKEQTRVKSPEAQSFLRLSNTAVMVASQHSVTVYNPRYHSTLATVKFDQSPDTLKRKRNPSDDNGTSNHVCKFVSYFPKLGMAMAIVDNDLVAVQIESQQDRHGKQRTAGLLIDSLGCGVRDQSRPGRDGVFGNKKTKLMGMITLDSFLPGSIDLGYPWAQTIASVEALFVNGTCDETDFDKSMEPHLGADWSEQSKSLVLNGTSAKNKVANGVDDQSSDKRRFVPSDIDRRWVIYALSKIFSWSTQQDETSTLTISFYPLNTFMWLTSNGYMTVANIEAALRSNGSFVTSIPAGQLVNSLVEIDPDMDLLYAVVAKSHLGASELLHAIRKLMGSLGLLGENPGTKQGLLTNGDEHDFVNGDAEEQFARLEAEAEEQMELAEHQLGPGSGTRGATLSLALSKLYSCPSDDITIALQTVFSSQEIVCLIYLLRFELARGGWTTRYTDVVDTEIVDEEANIQDSAIILIASLLNNCIDAVGTVGWLSGEARLAVDDLFEAEELIASLKLEVSAALEGIEESVYLKGVISELVKYADSFQRNMPQANTKDTKQAIDAPLLLQSADQEIKALPIGLKAEKQISLLKIGAGGAVHKRTARDIGFLKSQKVGKYSRERIVL